MITNISVYIYICILHLKKNSVFTYFYRLLKHSNRTVYVKPYKMIHIMYIYTIYSQLKISIEWVKLVYPLKSF